MVKQVILVRHRDVLQFWVVQQTQLHHRGNSFVIFVLPIFTSPGGLQRAKLRAQLQHGQHTFQSDSRSVLHVQYCQLRAIVDNVNERAICKQLTISYFQLAKVFKDGISARFGTVQGDTNKSRHTRGKVLHNR